MSYRKVGGLHHWRIGRLGGSFYISSRRVAEPSIAGIIASGAWFGPLVITLAAVGMLAS